MANPTINHSTFPAIFATGTAQTVPSSTGNLSVVTVCLGIGATVTSVTDNKTNSYVSAGTRGTDTHGGDCEIWYAKNAATGITSVTVNYSGAANSAGCGFYDIGGADTVSPLDAYNSLSNQAVSGSLSGPSVTPGSSGDCILTCVATGGTASAPGGGFTLDASTNGDGFAHELDATISAQTPTWTQSPTDTWCGATAAFKGASTFSPDDDGWKTGKMSAPDSTVSVW
jgi:hypothetical protein